MLIEMRYLTFKTESFVCQNSLMLLINVGAPTVKSYRENYIPTAVFININYKVTSFTSFLNVGILTLSHNSIEGFGKLGY